MVSGPNGTVTAWPPGTSCTGTVGSVKHDSPFRIQKLDLGQEASRGVGRIKHLGADRYRSARGDSPTGLAVTLRTSAAAGLTATTAEAVCCTRLALAVTPSVNTLVVCRLWLRVIGTEMLWPGWSVTVGCPNPAVTPEGNVDVSSVKLVGAVPWLVSFERERGALARLKVDFRRRHGHRELLRRLLGKQV